MTLWVIFMNTMLWKNAFRNFPEKALLSCTNVTCTEEVQATLLCIMSPWYLGKEQE